MALSMKNLTVQMNKLMFEDFLEHSDKLVKDGERSKNEHDILKSFIEIYRQSQPKSTSVKMQKDSSTEESHSDSGSSTSEKKKRKGKCRSKKE